MKMNSSGSRNLATGRRRQIERRGKTRREVRQRVEDAIRALEEDGIDESVSKSMTFRQLAIDWLKVYAASGVKRGSVRVREKEINSLNEYFANANLTELTHHLYQQMLLDLDKRGYAENTIRGINTCTNMIFNYAVRNNLMKENVRTGAVVPKKPVTVEDLEENTIEKTFFESDELDMFLDAVLKIRLELAREWFFTLAFTGMRISELCALHKQDLNFKDNTIRISKSLYLETNNPRKYEITTTKNNTVRVIDMDVKIMNMLKQLIRKNDKYKMKYRTQIESFYESDFVFQQKDGYPYGPKTIRDRMHRIMKYIDIEKHLTPHSLRHTHISLMTESGNDLPTIMQRVGHDDPNTTLRIYTHVTKKMKVKSLEKISTQHNKMLDNLTICILMLVFRWFLIKKTEFALDKPRHYKF